MASVPNRVYPQSEFNEIRTQTLRAGTEVITPIATVTSGSFPTLTATSGSFVTAQASTRVLSPIYNFTVKTATGSMNTGDLILITGSGGTAATLYLRVASGSGVAVYTIATTYSTGS
jgi:hypothetical protein